MENNEPDDALRMRKISKFVHLAHVRKDVFACRGTVTVYPGFLNMGIKRGFSCINICQVPREVPKAAVFNTSLGTWRMLMH